MIDVEEELLKILKEEIDKELGSTQEERDQEIIRKILEIAKPG